MPAGGFINADPPDGLISHSGVFEMTLGPPGGRFVFSPPVGYSQVILSINNGFSPVFPQPISGAYNIEVFFNPYAPVVPPPDAGFQTSIVDDLSNPLFNGFLAGDIALGAGDYLVTDSVVGSGQTGAFVHLGSGNQTVVGAPRDEIWGGSGSQVISALQGNQTVHGGSGNASIWGGANDLIFTGSGINQQIVLTGPGTRVVAGISGNATISAAAGDTVTWGASGSQSLVISAGQNNLIDLSGSNGQLAIIGAPGDTIFAGLGNTNVEGAAGAMVINAGLAGITNVSGSSAAGADTVIGASGSLSYNPNSSAGPGDLINLSGSTGNATINAFSFGATRIVAPDTIFAGNSQDSVWGGAGDRIGTGNAPFVGGNHLWTHADTGPGAVGFGSNDNVFSTAYDTVLGVATRGTTFGTSAAQVTISGFDTMADFIFYQSETAQTTNAIIATSQATTVAGMPSTIITLPDGTLMTLLGVTQAQLTPGLFRV